MRIAAQEVEVAQDVDAATSVRISADAETDALAAIVADALHTRSADAETKAAQDVEAPVSVRT